jgi:hypothetical protein
MELSSHLNVMRYYFYNIGIYIITTLDNTTVPAGPGRNYTINFNRLVNPSISYKPAVSFVGAGYIF